jgi:hypothetical protein
MRCQLTDGGSGRDQISKASRRARAAVTSAESAAALRDLFEAQTIQNLAAKVKEMMVNMGAGMSEEELQERLFPCQQQFRERPRPIGNRASISCSIPRYLRILIRSIGVFATRTQ